MDDSMIINGNILTPDDGCILTNGDVYSDLVYLGCYDVAENWQEVELTDEVKAIMEAEQMTDAQSGMDADENLL